MKKQNIIDTIFFHNDVDMLYFRLTELNEYVSTFIIMEDEDGKSHYTENKELFKQWEDKIIHVPSHLIETLLSKLLTIDLGFEDIILISDVNEIPDLTNFNLIHDYLKFGSVVLRQKKFKWSYKYINYEPHIGSFCFMFTDLVTSKDKVIREFTNKIDSWDIFDNGWCFSNFQQLEGELTPEDFDNLTEYDGILPKNINLLKSQDIDRKWCSKNLIILNVVPNSVSLELEKEYDSISYINFTDKILLEYEVRLSEKSTIHYILKPSQQYYDILIEDNNLSNFQKMYSVNEIKDVINHLLLLNQDLVSFSNGETDSHLITYSWGEIKNQFIYDLIKDIV
jgi:hypothetical protein